MEQKDKINPFTWICIALTLLALISTVLASFTAIRISKTPAYADFSAGWRNENGHEVEPEQLTGSCRLYKTILQIDNMQVFFCNARNLDVTVYIDETCVYETPRPENAYLKCFLGKCSGSDFVEVRIPKTEAGKTLCIDAKTPYSNSRNCKLASMYFGDGAAIIKFIIASHLRSFCLGIALLIVGAACIVLYFPLRRYQLADSSLLYLGMLAAVFGMVIMTDSRALQFVIGHESLFYTISQLFMILIPLPLLLFFNKLYGGLNKIIVIGLCSITVLDFIVIWTLNQLNIADYYENALIVLMILAVSILYIGGVTIQRMVLNIRENLFHNIGVIAIVVAVLLDLIATQTNAGIETSFFMRIGVAIFACLECIQMIHTRIRQYQKHVKMEIVSRLAYHDGLTDMLNRTSFMEDMQALEASPQPDVLLAVFDVNNLKYVNDTYGHSDGDELIINAANAITNAFGSMGKCYRVGGDEFVLIAVCDELEPKFQAARETLYHLLEEAEKTVEYPITVAVGYSVKGNRSVPLKDVLDEADTRMYENKRKMKEEAARLQQIPSAAAVAR